MDGRMDGWTEGSQSRVKDCSQQSKINFRSSTIVLMIFYCVQLVSTTKIVANFKVSLTGVHAEVLAPVEKVFID